MKIGEAKPDDMNAVHSCAEGFEPALDMPGQTCGMIGTHQMGDCSLEHPAARQAATRPAWRKPPLRNGTARERHSGSGERRPTDAVQPRHS